MFGGVEASSGVESRGIECGGGFYASKHTTMYVLRSQLVFHNDVVMKKGMHQSRGCDRIES
jgi:hypothetical protein